MQIQKSSILDFLVRDYCLNGDYAEQIKPAAIAGYKDDPLCSRWQALGIAIDIFAVRIFTTLYVFTIGVVVRPITALFRFDFGFAWEHFTANLCNLIHSIKIAVIFPFFIIAGIFAPGKVYGSIYSSINDKC